MEDIIKVAIADDHKIFRKGVILSLRSYVNLKFVMEAENGEDLIAKIKKLIDDEINQSAFSKEHKKILDQRLASHKMNPASGSNWKDVKRRIKAKL